VLLRTLRTTVNKRLSTLTPSLSGITITTDTPGSTYNNGALPKAQIPFSHKLCTHKFCVPLATPNTKLKQIKTHKIFVYFWKFVLLGVLQYDTTSSYEEVLTYDTKYEVWYRSLAGYVLYRL
jgi:hypothetical protein